VDRLYGWKPLPGGSIQDSLTRQDVAVKKEFEDHMKNISTQFAMDGFNTALYWKNPDFGRNVSMIPTSAHTGEGIPDLLALLVQLSQKMMTDRLLKLSTLQCTVLEVKKMPGRGTTLDVILANGELNLKDEILLSSLNGEPIRTRIRALLTPPVMTELRVKSDYVSHDKIRASMGCKIVADNLDEAMAGTPLYVITPSTTPDQVDEYLRELSKCLSSLNSKLNKCGEGVYVQASTLGATEALLEFLEDCKIPVFGFRIGPVHRKDIVKASTMLEKKKEYAVILAFDVPVVPLAREEAERQGVRIFESGVIYKLTEMFTQYLETLHNEGKERAKETAIFPCKLTILPQYIYNKKSPVIVGVHVDAGVLRRDTPICIPTKDFILLGKVVDIQRDKKPVEEGRMGEDVCVEILAPEDEKQFMIGRHFDEHDLLVSELTRESLNSLKEWFPEFCSEPDHFRLLMDLKKQFNL